MILLNPGPVNVSVRVRAALTGPDICHREPEYFDLQEAIRARLLALFDVAGGHYTAVLLTGSGTAAVEAMISSAVSDSGRLLVVRNGTYGDRMARMAWAHRIACDVFDVSWTERPCLERLRERLAQTRYEALAIVHHETTTGLLNDLASVSALCQHAGVRLLVDAVSSLGGERLDLPVLKPAAVCATANKCLQGLPGVSFVLIDRAFVQDMAAFRERTLYLHLPRHYDAQEQRSTAFTPAIPASRALLAALDELAEETVQGRIARFGRAAAIVRHGLERRGFELLLPPALRATTLTAVTLPRGLVYADLHDALKDEGFVIYAGQGPQAATQFRVATMGAVPESEYVRFVEALGRAADHCVDWRAEPHGS